MLKSVEYSRARRISSAFMTGLPSSEMATHPAPTNSPISANSSPLLPLVMAPMGKTCTAPSRRARSMMKSVTDWLSLTGVVLAMQHTDVKPPRAAARVPVAMVSMSSRPGSRRWTCRSTKPGQTTFPRASRTRSAAGAGCVPGTCHLGNAPVLDQEVQHRVPLVRRIDHAPACDQDSHGISVRRSGFRFAFAPSRANLRTSPALEPSTEIPVIAYFAQ